ncbi:MULTISPECIES: bifunctional UDP-sugar hydrolase/5'-nucleotidase [unclassified Blastococcus]|uniref:bifunctional metallophosphatase/5'-nucleotidase n=2 Tax=Blastococcus TaxID=38501 RepID=UPI001EEFB521|nr:MULTISPECIES: 5'-nucleotidase C-terminal domain-containing protein [unclassified Blastococcus]MCF6512932.1 bifunctional metallophosphatase/5'-nucleotidase [Blastococcus sp. MG754427]MCF6734271.1 bifunctional metallophosphatase/5'-nucleotidase [Blastococcus sp. KM273129]
MSLKHLRRGTVVATVAVASLAGGTLAGTATAAPAQDPRPDFTLTLLHANDLESALLPVTADDGGTYGGADRFVELIRRQQMLALTGPRPEGAAKNRGVVTVSAGDNFLPGPQLAASEESGRRIYDATAFNAARFDVSIPGNHDFDLGPDFFAEWIGDIRPETTIVSSNLGFEQEPALLARVADGTVVTSHVVEESGEQIGFIGLTTPDLARLTSSRDVTIDPDLAGIANAQAAAYEAAGVDKVVLVSHLQDIENEVALATELRGVDVIIGGGGHELLADEGDPLVPNGTDVFGSYPLTPTDADGEVLPVVTTAALYSYVGRLVVSFDAAGEVVTVHDDASRVLPVAAQGPDAVPANYAVNRWVVEPVQEYVADLAEQVVATSQVDLNGIRDDVRSRETNLGNLATDALLAAGRREAAAAGVTPPVVALQNGGGIRNAAVIPAGEITALDTYTVLPFSNFVGVAPAMPVETFIAGVERGLSGLPGAAGQFAQAAGYRVTYDVTQPVGSRVVDLVLDDGTALVEGGVPTGALETIPVATIDFLLRGGDGYPFDGVAFTVLPVTYQEALETYLVEDLGGVVSATDYPVGGEGRITPVA